MKNILLRNTLISGLDSIILVIIGFILVSFLITTLGTEQYGIYVILTMLSLYSTLNFFDFGLEGAITYYISTYVTKSDRNNEVQIAFQAIVLYSIIGFIVVSALFYFQDSLIKTMHTNILIDEMTLVLTIVFINLFIQFLSVPIIAIIEGNRLFHITKILNSGTIILQFILILIILPLYQHLISIFLIILISTILKYFILVYFFKSHILKDDKFTYTFDLIILKQLFSYSSTLFLSRIIGFIYNQTDKLLIWIYLNPIYMTIYDVITKPIMPMRIILQILESSLVPEIAMYNQKRKFKKISLIYRNFVRYAYIIMIPMSVVLFFFIQEIITLWVNQDLANNYQISYFMIIFFLMLPVPSVAVTILAGLKKINLTIYISLFSAIFNIILSFFLIKHFYLYGLLFATVLSQILTIYPIVKRFNNVTKSSSKIFQLVSGIFIYHVPFLVLIYVMDTFIRSSMLAMLLVSFACLFQYIISYFLWLTKREKYYIQNLYTRI